MGKKITTKDFIEKSKTFHGDKYDYTFVDYVNNITPVCIICPKHGEFLGSFLTKAETNNLR